MIRSNPVQTIVTAQSPNLLQYLNPLHLIHNLWHHRELIRQFTRREIEVRYRGSFLGLFWSFINPLVLLLIYTFVFGLVFKQRWPNAQNNSLGEFSMVLFCGLTAYNIFNETVIRAPGTIIGVPNYVKKVVFPLEILPVSVLGSALFHALVSLSILLVANAVFNQTIHITIFLLPLVALPLVLLALGLGWFLASLGVFVRDASYTIGLLLQILIFTTPIFYPFEAIPEYLQPYIRLNPLVSVVNNFRRVILWGLVPEWGELFVWIIINATVMLFGYAWFMKTKKAFADVI